MLNFIPGDDSRMILQPIARSELELPVFKTFDSNVITSEFESAAKTLPLLYEYGLGSDSQLMSLLQRDWTRVENITSVISRFSR